MGETKQFGSGYFGEWITGEHGLPAYRYTVDQTVDQKAVTMTNPAWRARTDHTFLFGNDRISATVSNYGYFQVRQDEGGPKFLTDHCEKRNRYGAGFGYLTFGGKTLCTYYAGGNQMTREYGAGYFKKSLSAQTAQIEELHFAPYGDDPAIVSAIKIKNTGKTKENFRWYQYYCAEFYQFSFTHFALAQLSFNTANVSRLRRAFASSFYKEVTVEDGAVFQKWSYNKLKKTGVRFLNSLSDSVMRKAAKRFYDTEKVFTVDRNPPEAAVLLSGGEFSGVLCDADAFFGKGGVYSPDYFRKNETTNENGNPRQAKNAMLAPFIDFSLNAGEEKVLTFVYLYFPADKDKNALVEKYKNCDAKKLFLESCQSWHAEGVNAEIEGEEWISRELKWHNAYLRGGMSYADFYGAHILSQGGHYQYLMGLQGAPRDQLQHSLPYIYSDPQIAREHIMFTLREMSPEGELPYATTGQGVLISFVMVPSDLQFMLLSFAGEFALATRDTDFFNSTYVCKFKGKETTRTVWEGIKLAYKYATQNVGKGEHGLIRMKTGDWNDQAVYGRVPLTQTRTAQKFGESMLNSAMAVYSFKVFSEAAKLMGDQALFAEAKKWSDDLREAVAAQWNGNWFKRAWMGKKVGWLGDDLLWLEPQPWALIGGAAEGEKAEILVKNIDKQLCTINPNGAALLSSGGEQSAGLDTGVLENGGIWYAINGYLVWALAKAGYGDLAFLEWKKNTRAYQAEAYPDIWYGIWSAPDSVNSSFAKYPGRTQNSKNPVTGKREKLFKLTVGVDWEDYPVLNLHAHTWQQYALFKLLGLEFESGKMTIKPAIPKQRYSVTSKLFSLSFDGKTYRVKYNPLNSVNITVVFDTGANPAKSLTLNGKQTAFETMGSAIGFPVSGSGVEFEIEV